MKPTVTQKLDEVLGLEAAPEETSTELVVHEPAEIVSSGNPDKDMEADMEFARKAIHNLVDKGTELVDNANFFAREKQDARSVEAAAAAQDSARENILALVNLHKTKKEIDRLGAGGGNGGGDTNITQNAVFVGTTGELLKFTKEMNSNGALNKALKVLDVAAEPAADALNTKE